MNRIEEMLWEMCPEGVEYRKLEEILTIKNGSDYKSFPSGDIPVYGSGGVIAYTSKFAYDKPSVLIPRKGSVDKLYYVDVPFWNVDTIFYTEINTDIVIPRYVYHWLKREHLERLNIAGGVPSLTQAALNKVLIPIPPLPIQQEIVRILDAFTSLKAELTAELTMRKKQYEYYREKLLTFDGEHECGVQRIDRMLQELCPEGVEHKELRKVSVMQRGTAITKKDSTAGTYPVISGGREPAYYCSNYNRDGETVTVAGSGAGAGFVNFWSSPIFVADAFSIKGINNVSTKYLYYCLTNMQDKIYATQKGGGVPHVHISSIEKFKIPVPPLEIQQEIVRILDRFDALCSSLTAGLPAEIEARQKQYEYYRDKLLTFPVKVA